ncbi:hypothetical protein BOTBODRAFT_174041 [Botryobasidium botryosum FD-172 SS1]|uniref:SCP domain-containing protein n=1 Tax=Botryobasidium botryosum (strain FD-172 SS1) TaxID=930990 RepID=A0A067MKD2_BOTB1|nr:hypothetical protein BOTBODRAFT_174041 [Botryobasidium botryosum FD-172 SS1]
MLAPASPEANLHRVTTSEVEQPTATPSHDMKPVKTGTTDIQVAPPVTTITAPLAAPPVVQKITTITISTKEQLFPTTTTTSSKSHSTPAAIAATSTSSKPQSTPTNTDSIPTSSTTSQSDIDAYLTGHNTVRAQHGAEPLTWSDNLAEKAQQWSNGCVFQHSGGVLGAFGENLAAGTGSGYTIASGIKSWTDEASTYSFGVPSHFTQVVWKGTTQVGCAFTMCSGIFDASFGLARYIVCEYSPQGNIIGEFAANVQV